MDQTDRVLDFCLNLGWGDLPAEVQRQMKRCLLDGLGVMIAGSRAPVAALMADYARANHAGADCVILAGGTASPVGAVLANGFTGNALDMDDGYRATKGHPGAGLFPVLLTCAQLNPAATGRDLLAALAAGYELSIRAGILRHAAYQAYHCTGSWNAVAGVAAGGKLLGLDAAVIREAMGAAEYHAPFSPMMKGIAVPAMVKDAIGWGAMVAMASLEMAQRGFTGVTPFFNDDPGPELCADLGSRWRSLELYFKPYAGCRWAQPAVAGALKVAREHHLAPGDIAAIAVRTFAEAVALVNAAPNNTEEAQYNLAFGVAAALLDGRVGPDQVLPPRIFAPELTNLMAKVTVEADEEIQKEFPARTIAEVVVTTTDGRSLASGPCEPLWEWPATSPSDQELSDKFSHITEPVLGAQRSRQLADFIWNLDSHPRADQLAFLAQV